MEAQMLAEVPTEPWDKTMDALCFGKSGLIEKIAKKIT
jgi:5-formyltetrahydrofolate cyclo-ligase